MIDVTPRGRGYRIRGRFDAATAERLLDAGIMTEWRPGYYAENLTGGRFGDLTTDEVSRLMVDVMVPFLRDLGVVDVIVEHRPATEWAPC